MRAIKFYRILMVFVWSLAVRAIEYERRREFSLDVDSILASARTWNEDSISRTIGIH